MMLDVPLDASSLLLSLLLLVVAASYLFVVRRASSSLISAGTGTLRIGDRARIQGLLSKPEFNGRTARVIGTPDASSGRYPVEVEPTTAETLHNVWKPRISLLVRPANLVRLLDEEGHSKPASALPSAKLPADDDGSDVCHRCLEVMAPLSWRGNERNRAVCCGNQLCAACWTSSLRRRDELSRRLAELKRQPRESVDRAAAKELLEELERSDRCDLCRAQAPHSPEASFEAVRRHAEAGRPWAMYMLGNKYQTGAGVGTDHRKAYEWFQKAAIHPRPHPNAAQALGSVYLAGAGVRADYAEALRWLRPAADAGHATAMHNLGQMYSEGLGVRRSAQEAARWWLRGAEEGSHQCQSDLGCCYEHGEGVRQSDAEAQRWFTAAAEQGNATAMYNLGGVLFRNGQAQGRPELLREAVEWCRKAAAGGNADAVAMLKQLQPQ